MQRLVTPKEYVVPHTWHVQSQLKGEGGGDRVVGETFSVTSEIIEEHCDDQVSDSAIVTRNLSLVDKKLEADRKMGADKNLWLAIIKQGYAAYKHIFITQYTVLQVFV